MNRDKPVREWEADIRQSVRTYEDFYAEKATQAYRDLRKLVAADVEVVLRETHNLTRVDAAAIRQLSARENGLKDPEAWLTILGSACIPPRPKNRFMDQFEYMFGTPWDRSAQWDAKTAQFLNEILDPQVMENPHGILTSKITDSRFEHAVIPYLHSDAQCEALNKYLEAAGYKNLTAEKPPRSIYFAEDVKKSTTKAERQAKVAARARVTSQTGVYVVEPGKNDGHIDTLIHSHQGSLIYVERKSTSGSGIGNRMNENLVRKAKSPGLYILFIWGYFATSALKDLEKYEIDWAWQHRPEDLDKILGK